MCCPGSGRGRWGGPFPQSQVQRALNSPPSQAESRLPPVASLPSSTADPLRGPCPASSSVGGMSLLHVLSLSHSPPCPSLHLSQPVPLVIPEGPGSLYTPIPINARDSRLAWAPGTPATRTEGPALLTPTSPHPHKAVPSQAAPRGPSPVGHLPSGPFLAVTWDRTATQHVGPTHTSHCVRASGGG